jgi:predicted acyl esterase
VADIGVSNRPRTAKVQQKNNVVLSNGVKQGQEKLLTFVYKVEDGVDIEADVYLPNGVPSCPMPIGASPSDAVVSLTC